MNTFTLQIRIRQSDGALERILGVTRRRQFALSQLSVSEAGRNAPADFDVEMTVRGERAPAFLVRQLEKLEDVAELSMVAAPVELVGRTA
jgi:acetolactate synthase regulatory subunit